MGRDRTEVIGFAGVIGGGVVPRAGLEGGVANALEQWAAGEEGFHHLIHCHHSRYPTLEIYFEVSSVNVREV